MGDHVRGHIAGEGTLGGHGNGLCAVGDMELVGFDQHLDAAQRRERGEKRDFAAFKVEVSVTQQPYQLLHEVSGFKMVEIHLPVAGHQRNAFGRHMFPF